MTTRSIKELLADPEFLEQLAKGVEEELTQRRREREQFVSSQTFQRMVAALRDNPQPLRVDSEEIAYFAERVKAAVGWEFATENDVRLFFDVVGSPNADTVEPGSLTEDEDCMFDNCSFWHYGLYVWMMSGQGTAISICNKAAAPKKDSAVEQKAA
jgi:hypothetical protein